MTAAPYYRDDTVTLHLGDCLKVLPTLADASIDAIVTDPPYGLGFMGKEWDTPGSFVERRPAKVNTSIMLVGTTTQATRRTLREPDE